MFSRCPTSLRLTLATLSRSLHTSTWTCGGIPTPTAPRVKRPSPYRLLLIHTFLSSFAPLHVAGWRLVSVPKTTSSQLSTISIRDSVDEEVRDVHVGMYREADHQPGDLQDRRLIRSYQFAQGRLGWQDCSQFISRICVEVQSEDVRLLTPYPSRPLPNPPFHFHHHSHPLTSLLSSFSFPLRCYSTTRPSSSPLVQNTHRTNPYPHLHPRLAM